MFCILLIKPFNFSLNLNHKNGILKYKTLTHRTNNYKNRTNLIFNIYL